MRFKQIVLYSVSALMLTVGSSALAVEQSHSGDGHPMESALKLNSGKKWQTDAPLRQGMEGIRNDLSAALPAIHRNTLSTEQYGALANKIENHIGYIVKNCKLAPDADAQLHVVLGEITQGTEALKSAGNRHDAAMRIAKALDTYGNYFDHPNWPRRAGS